VTTTNDQRSFCHSFRFPIAAKGKARPTHCISANPLKEKEEGVLPPIRYGKSTDDKLCGVVDNLGGKKFLIATDSERAQRASWCFYDPAQPQSSVEGNYSGGRRIP